MEPSPAHLAILAVIQGIPRGHVMTYGQIAEAAGLPRRARLVGQLLRRLPDGTDLPWHRVVNAQGTISERAGGAAGAQRRLLEREGVSFDEAERIELEVHRYVPARRGRANSSSRKAGARSKPRSRL
jgi:methylated-DNA-protein-cysteine methyltransferase-like protein